LVIAFTGNTALAEPLDYNQLVGLWEGTISNDRSWSSSYSLEILQAEVSTKKVIARQYCPNCSGGRIKYSSNWTLTDNNSKIEFTSPADSQHTEKLWVLETPTKLSATGKYLDKAGLITNWQDTMWDLSDADGVVH
jgi:hypothetical protein